jgi:hypothetical protein
METYIFNSKMNVVYHLFIEFRQRFISKQYIFRTVNGNTDMNSEIYKWASGGSLKKHIEAVYMWQ